MHAAFTPEAPMPEIRKEAFNRLLQDGPWPAAGPGGGGGMTPKGGGASDAGRALSQGDRPWSARTRGGSGAATDQG